MEPCRPPPFSLDGGQGNDESGAGLGHQPFAGGPEATGGAYADIDVCNRNSHRHVYLYDGDAGRGVEAITLRMIVEPMSLLLFLLIALFAGWLAGQIMGRAMGVVGSLVVGVLGALLGGFLFRLLATSLDVSLRHDLPPYVWSSVVAFVGAVVVLLLLRAVEERA